MSTEAQKQAAAHARAIKDCKSNGQCLFPYCKLMVAQCWTQEQIDAVRNELRSSSSRA